MSCISTQTILKSFLLLSFSLTPTYPALPTQYSSKGVGWLVIRSFSGALKDKLNCTNHLCTKLSPIPSVTCEDNCCDVNPRVHFLVALSESSENRLTGTCLTTLVTCNSQRSFLIESRASRRGRNPVAGKTLVYFTYFISEVI